MAELEFAEEFELSPEELSAANLAAMLAEMSWCEKANHDDRKGKQLPPPDADYNILLWMAGRGFGKTEALSQAMWQEMWRVPGILGHYATATKGDVRGTLFEGVTGLQAVTPAECLKGGSWEIAYKKSLAVPELLYANGSKVRGFATTEEGERMRGPQCHVFCGDEVAAWDRPAGNLKIAFHNAALGTRLKYPDGTPARMYLGTTPKPIAFLKELMARKDVITVRGTTYENLRNLADNYKAEILVLEGTALGRQEIHGEILDLEELGIFRRSWFQLWPAGKKLPEFAFIIVSYDTAASEHDIKFKKDTKSLETDYNARTVWGVFNIAQQFPEEAKRRGPLNKFPKYGVLLCDAWQDRISFPELIENARKQARIKWGSPGRKADLVLIEDKSSGRQLRQMLAEHGVKAWPFNPGQMSKTMRAHAGSPMVFQKMVYVPESRLPERKGLPRDWVVPFLDQVCAYAGEGSVEYDDYLDTFTQMLLYLHGAGMLQPHKQIKEDPDVVKEREERAAMIEKEREKAGRNPYAQ